MASFFALLKIYLYISDPVVLISKKEGFPVRLLNRKKLKRYHLRCLETRTLLKLAQPRWTSHITKMPEERLPKKVLYGKLQVEKRSQGCKQSCYKDTFNSFRKDRVLSIDCI